MQYYVDIYSAASIEYAHITNVTGKKIMWYSDFVSPLMNCLVMKSKLGFLNQTKLLFALCRGVGGEGKEELLFQVHLFLMPFNMYTFNTQ